MKVSGPGTLLIIATIGWLSLVTCSASVSDEVALRHWAFKPLAGAMPTRVKDTTRVQTGVDSFILARLEEKGLTLAPIAEKRILIRRATFDLIGLPPTPEEVAAFVNDNSPEAFAKVVSRLLSSPHYGERWGRHWLDV